MPPGANLPAARFVRATGGGAQVARVHDRQNVRQNAVLSRQIVHVSSAVAVALMLTGWVYPLLLARASNRTGAATNTGMI